MRTLLFVLLTGWAVAFFGSFLVFFLTATEAGGLDTDLSKLSRFLIWQAVAMVLTFLCMVVRWSTKDAVERRLAAIPSMGFGVLVLVAGSVVVVTNLKAASQGTDLSTINQSIVPFTN